MPPSSWLVFDGIVVILCAVVAAALGWNVELYFVGWGIGSILTGLLEAIRVR